MVDEVDEFEVFWSFSKEEEEEEEELEVVVSEEDEAKAVVEAEVEVQGMELLLLLLVSCMAFEFESTSSLVEIHFSCLRSMLNIACDLEDEAFMSVEPVERYSEPFCKQLKEEMD